MARSPAVLAAAAAAFIFALPAGTGHGGLPAGDAVARLAGRWAGQGTVSLTGGQSLAFKCVVTYFPAAEGARVQQNLRCHNGEDRIDAATHLEFEGTRVTGRWEDKIHDLSGTVSGALTAEGFRLQLDGRFFQARMDVTGLECQQSVEVQPKRGGEDIRQIHAALSRC